MKTRIAIDDRLMSEALEVSGCETKSEAVEEGLKLLIKMNRQQDIRKLRGKIKWDGNLDDMRSTSYS
ncbi:MAG: type II toxin-antitoxin system VapB family antitoxin [Natronospirillum sp.]|uniref:type II toxin-antitoxin system VapB family antitoxin n=1 Tax=Natronospirillum sp. TaxID=2812955 RepID=UPI0025F2572F|nr:type II toxin-antitoxin system VapB family antitoxin [Natronospirillum sp.]MCH8552807.1 type II toxin-antitoxin system VapB family antitoxin [Natronospirillum sp.]